MMVATVLGIAMIAAAPASAPPRSASSSPAALFQRTARRYETVARYWIRADVTKGSEGVQTYVVATAPGGRFRDESPHWLRVSDGRTLHESVRSLGQRTSGPAPKRTLTLEAMMTSPGFTGLTQIRVVKSPPFLRRQSVVADGGLRDVVVMRATGSTGEAFTYWIDADRALVVRSEMRMDLPATAGAALPPGLSSSVTVVADNSTLAFDSPVPDSLFTPYARSRADRPVPKLDYTAPGRALEGAAAPDFSLPDLTGKPWTLSAQRGQVLVLHFRALDGAVFRGGDLELLQAVAGTGGVQPVVIGVVMNRDFIRDDMRHADLTCPALLDESGSVAAAYHALPGAFVVIGRDGRVAKSLVAPGRQELSAAIADATAR